MTAKTLENIIGDFETAAALIAGIAPMFGPAGLPVAAGAALAYKLLPALQAGVKAHETATGKPLTLADLHEIPLIMDQEIKDAHS